MYLTERIIGIVTYMIFMLLFFYLIYHSDSKKKLKRYLIIYWGVLAVLAFFYIPDTSADLSRLWDELHRYSKIGYYGLVKILFETTTPTRSIYFWIISRFGIDGFLPAITSCLFFGNVFIIIYKCAIKYNLDNKYVAISLLFFMEFGKFLEVISDIRALLAFSIIALCIYTEIVENKKIIRNFLLYIIAVFLHPAAMILALIRVFFLLMQKEQNIARKIINFLLVVVLVFIVFKYANNSLTAATAKAESYLNHEVYSYIWEYILCWTYVIFSTYTLVKYRKYLIENTEIVNLKKIILCINLLVVFFNYEYSIFNRFSTFSGILFIPIFAFILQKMSENNQYSRKEYTYLFMAVSIFVFIIAGTRGNLCGYKFFILN